MNALFLLLLASAVRAEPPPWMAEPCAGVDCGAFFVGVGQADVLPEPRLTSAVACAQAARALGGALGDAVAVNARSYGEERGAEADSVVRSVVRSPLGAAMTKAYGEGDADVISVTVDLKPSPATRVFAQEVLDEREGALYVRLLIAKTAAAEPAGFAVWAPRRLRLSTQDVRVGGKNELTMLVEDLDAGLSWMERWPTGGGDLMRGAEVAAKYVHHGLLRSWIPGELARSKDPLGAGSSAGRARPDRP